MTAGSIDCQNSGACVIGTNVPNNSSTVHLVKDEKRVAAGGLSKLNRKDILDRIGVKVAEDNDIGIYAAVCRSYMFCQYGYGIIYLKDAGQTFKDQVEEKVEDELLITLNILQGMVGMQAKGQK